MEKQAETSLVGVHRDVIALDLSGLNARLNPMNQMLEFEAEIVSLHKPLLKDSEIKGLAKAFGIKERDVEDTFEEAIHKLQALSLAQFLLKRRR